MTWNLKKRLYLVHFYAYLFEINERLNHEENIDYLYCLVLKCVLFLLFNVDKNIKNGSGFETKNWVLSNHND